MGGSHAAAAIRPHRMRMRFALRNTDQSANFWLAVVERIAFTLCRANQTQK
jgi:hypothetical protein